MIAYLYAYGKQKSLHYGTALIAKDLLPVRGELETLSAYQGHQQGERSFRHGYLDNGMEYFSFAYALLFYNKSLCAIKGKMSINIQKLIKCIFINMY